MVTILLLKKAFLFVPYGPIFSARMKQNSRPAFEKPTNDCSSNQKIWRFSTMPQTMEARARVSVCVWGGGAISIFALGAIYHSYAPDGAVQVGGNSKGTRKVMNKTVYFCSLIVKGPPEKLMTTVNFKQR